MAASPLVDPQAVFSVLVGRKGRADRHTTLDAIHAACGEIVASGSAVPSLTTMARELEARGILKGRALYNAQSRDYRALVSAWVLAAGLPSRVGADRRASERAQAKLTGITDLATRAWIKGVLADNDAMHRQIDLFVYLMRGLAP